MNATPTTILRAFDAALHAIRAALDAGADACSLHNDANGLRIAAEGLCGDLDRAGDPDRAVWLVSFEGRATEARELAERALRAHQAGPASREVGDGEALDAIRDVLDGQEWSADTAPEVARHVRRTGRRVRDVDDVPEVDDTPPDDVGPHAGAVIREEP